MGKETMICVIFSLLESLESVVSWYLIIDEITVGGIGDICRALEDKNPKGILDSHRPCGLFGPFPYGLELGLG
ncbi:hypothetical protein VNO77_04059 [Canavalia gladiata]|uniref:Uncharacterized protein n=1 Tax=Canavalia gladiata TaxID=3824 RepID=A0AAN9N105_CANGL